MGKYLTKSADTLKFAPPVEGERRQAQLKFRPASNDELKALGENLPDGYVAGWASTNDLDLYRHRVMKGAFSEAIQKRGLTGPRGIKLLVGHDWNRVAGVIKKLEYRGTDLWIEAQLNLNIGYAKDAYEAAKMVGGLSFSVGFMLQDYAVKGNQEDGEWLQIDKGDLYEVSVVPFPGNEEATMTFIKDASGQQIENANTPAWKSGAARNLPINDTRPWDGAAARARIFAAAGFDDDNPDAEMARRAFLVYDSANPTLRGGYKLPFADIVDGRMTALSSGIRAAASRLPQTDGLSADVRREARAVIESYENRMENLSADGDDDDIVELSAVSEFEKVLIASGLLKGGRRDAKRVTLLVKANLALFQKTEPGPAPEPTPENDPPRLAAETVHAFKEALANMRKSLERASQS